jgi:hypothetical protein
MSRVINPDSVGKERSHLSKSIVLALRSLAKQAEVDETTLDLAAFIALALLRIDATIDISVQAWEKRGYWVKADKFRMEWMWTRQLGEQMRTAVIGDDWGAVAMVAAQVGQKLVKVMVPERHRLGTPWVGAHALLKKQLER